MFSVLLRKKITVNENISFIDYASGIWFPDCSKLAINWKIAMTSQFSEMMSSFADAVYWLCFVFLVNLSYWPNFHVNIITGSGVVTIFFYKGLTRNLENGNTPFEFCPISGDWGELEVPNLARTSPIKCYWILQSARVTPFTVSELLRKNQQGGKITPLPTQIRVNRYCEQRFLFMTPWSRDYQVPDKNVHGDFQIWTSRAISKNKIKG